MIIKKRWLFPAAIIFLLCTYDVNATAVNDPPNPASVLLNQFETVVYVKGEVLLSTEAYHNVKSEVRFLRFPFEELLSALNALGGNTSIGLLSESEAVLLGAKDFRAPSGLGIVRSQRCYIVVLKTGSRFDLRKQFHDRASGSVFGAPVLRWSASVGEYGEEDPTRPTSFFAAQILGSYLLVSNTLDQLRVTANGLNSAKEPAILSQIRDWDLINKRSLWAYRRYLHNANADREASGISLVSPNAQALSFFVDFDEGTSVLRLSSAVDEKTPAAIAEKMKLPQFKHLGDGVWETRISLRGDEESAYRVGAILELLGFGTYV
jgi:hypothetical protein